MCDSWDKQFCVNQKCQSEPDLEGNYSRYNFDMYPWMCRPLSYRFNGGIINDADEYEYNDTNYFGDNEVDQERTLKDITKHVLSHCKFDTGLLGKAKYIGSVYAKP